MRKRHRIYTIIMAALAAALLLAACQPTPDNEIIENKNANVIENIVSGNSENHSYLPAFPNEWKTTVEDTNLMISVDAKLIVPELNNIKLIPVEPNPFSVDSINSVIDAAFPNAQLFDGMQEYQMTKQDIENKLVEIRLAINDPDSQLAEYSEDERAAYIKDTEEYIKTLEGMYTTAPEESTIEPISLTKKLIGEGAFIKLRKPDSPDVIGSVMIGSADMENGKTAKIILSFPSASAHSQTKAQNELTISEETAIKASNEMLTKLGIQNMYIDRVLLVDNGQGKRYRCAYSKTYAGLQETYVPQEQTENALAEDADYAFLWTGEYILIDVDDEGVKMVEWASPTKQKEDNSNPDIQLLPFIDIQESFTKQVKYQEKWIDPESGISSRKIYIEEIRLGTMKVKVQGDTQEYVMIPVWDFFGYSIDKYKEQLPGGYPLDENMEYKNTVLQNFVTINACDGTIIDRVLGY